MVKCLCQLFILLKLHVSVKLTIHCKLKTALLLNEVLGQLVSMLTDTTTEFPSSDPWYRCAARFRRLPAHDGQVIGSLPHLDIRICANLLVTHSL